MKINTSDLKAEGLNIEETLPPDEIMGDDVSTARFDHDIKARLSAVITGEFLIVKGSLETTARSVCHRCLKEFDLPLHDGDYQFLHKLASHDREEVDLGESIREALVLLVPQKLLCRDDCRGLCPICGQDLNEKSCSCKKEDRLKAFDELDKLNLHLIIPYFASGSGLL